MNRVTHFEIHAEDPARAIAFYQRVFGWKFESWGSELYWIVNTGTDSEPGINGGLLKRKGSIDGTAVIAYVCSIEVMSADVTVAAVKGHGGQNVVPKMAVPGVGWLAYCKDTEGNIFGVFQEDKEAK